MTQPSIRPARRAWLAALLLSPILALATPAAHADALDTITKAGVLKVAVPEDYPPFGSVGPDMQPQGYDIDTAALLASR
jgi:polar amino acid transport system substrate-binding protein